MYAVALAVTVMVEVPAYLLLGRWALAAPGRRADRTGLALPWYVGVNLVSHPLLWFWLVPAGVAILGTTAEILTAGGWWSWERAPRWPSSSGTALRSLAWSRRQPWPTRRPSPWGWWCDATTSPDRPDQVLVNNSRFGVPAGTLLIRFGVAAVRSELITVAGEALPPCRTFAAAPAA